MLPETWTILKLLKWTTAYFKSHHIEHPRAAAEILLAHTLGVGRVDLYIQYDRPLEAHELEIFKGFIQRRVQREPVAYIVGNKEFWSMDLKVTPDVLIPRPETETLVEVALTIMPPEPGTAPLKIMDLGTGSGAIVLAMASERPEQCFFAVDHRNEGSIARVMKDGGGAALMAGLCGGRLLSGAYIDRRYGTDTQRTAGAVVQALPFAGSVNRQHPPCLTVVVIVKQDLLIGMVREILLAA